MMKSCRCWSLIGAFILLLLLKTLFLFTYHSTDFEVHRNWLAITASLPISKWYTENTSQWTLDYPPFFAWFEYLLSIPATYVDSQMLEVSNLEYASRETVLYQRLTVMVADTVLLVALILFSSTMIGGKQVKVGAMLCVLCSFGLFVVDHIHFQYNGFLSGILFLSFALLARGQAVLGSIAFAALLNFKHIYVYVAPAVFVFLLRTYCFDSAKPISFGTFKVSKFIILGSVVIAVFALSFGPFIAMGQVEQVFSRLFPFKRGLTHAYWAANVWALYNTVDKVASVASGKKGESTFTGGLVTDEQDHAVLPNISPLVTFALTFLAMLPFLWKMLMSKAITSRTHHLIVGVTLCAYTSFLFGWHVHEKAALLFQLPLSLVAFDNKKLARAHFLAQLSGGYALFPLIFTEKETFGVLALFVAYMSFLYLLHNFLHRGNGQIELTVLEKVYVLGLVLVHVFVLGFPHVMGEKLPFLPLMLTSSYSAVGVLYSYVLVYLHALEF
eukprot:m.137612 g.137612  ORF g.137612 m.137612 type:complete len:499 (+) comp12022_c0_seq1:49-1545(+)